MIGVGIWKHKFYLDFENNCWLVWLAAYGTKKCVKNVVRSTLNLCTMCPVYYEVYTNNWLNSIYLYVYVLTGRAPLVSKVTGKSCGLQGKQTRRGADIEGGRGSLLPS
jgi:hypothetical protein